MLPVLSKERVNETMLTDLKSRFDTAEIAELMSYAVAGDPSALEHAALEYQQNSGLELFGWEDDGLVVGLVGFEETEDGSLELRHIAVLPENRGKGYARGMILELMTQRNPRYVVAETTDESTADFYRALGFMVYSLGDGPNGAEVLRCVYEVEEPEED
ncbi:hypothetical protein D3C81_342360 [compost metagenome]